MENKTTYNPSLFTAADFKAARDSWVFDLCGNETTNLTTIPGMNDLLRVRDEDSEKMRGELNRGPDIVILFGDKAPTESEDLKYQYDRIWRMALPFGTYGCKHYHSEELLADILYALDWMHDNMYGAKIVTDTSESCIKYASLNFITVSSIARCSIEIRETPAHIGYIAGFIGFIIHIIDHTLVTAYTSAREHKELLHLPESR